MSRILIAHASRFGQTRTLAHALATRLRARGHTVDIACARDVSLPPPASYDAVILGSRIELGHHAPEIIDYIREHRAELETRPSAFYSVSLAAAVPFAGVDPRGYLLKMFRELDWVPDHAVAFGRVGTPQVSQLADLVATALPSLPELAEMSPAYGPM
jgi:menaquinone-dependent protoporphyrinogen oxidase